jgi:HEPN domain-containing protein
MKKITKDWFDSAESDLMLIRQIMYDENLTHLASFHAQQAVEKSFKAVIEEYDLGNIKSHSLENLYNKISDKLKQDIVLETLSAQRSPLNAHLYAQRSSLR